MPEALRAEGVEIRVNDEMFPQGTQDVDWLRIAGESGWVVITRDDRIRLQPTGEGSRHRRKASVLQHHIVVSDRRGGRIADSLCSGQDVAAVAGRIRSVGLLRKFRAVQM